MSQSTILTGQYVRISQTPASVGERLIALFIDYVLVILYVIGMSVLLERLRIHAFSSLSFFFLFGFVFLPALCYPLLCEVFNRGQSVGKRLLNLRVVKVDGSTPSLSSYLLRWLLFIVDVPLTGGLGLVVVLLTKNNQRLGDLAAGTMVIKEKNYRKIHVSLDEFDHLTSGYRPRYPQAADLSIEQVNTINKVLIASVSSTKGGKQLAALAYKIRTTLALPESATNTDDTTLLHTLLRDYQYYALEEV
ncbi:MAG: RDD family protein [Bacteroides sp.]